MTPTFLRDEAAHFRQLANATDQERSQLRLRTMADDFEVLAELAEAETQQAVRTRSEFQPTPLNKTGRTIMVRTHQSVPSVLIVEDEPLVMQVLLGVLNEDYIVRCATTVEEARACLRASVVDLVLLDSVLSDGSSDGLIGLAENLGVSVITMSGYPRDRCLGPEHGHLSKPFSVDSMLNEVQVTLKQRTIQSNE